VNTRRILHVVLIAAVWLSQLAATLHLVGHLDTHEHSHQSASLECIQANFHSHESFNHGLASENPECGIDYAGHVHKAPSSAEISKECSQYHVYLGMYACIAAPTVELESPKNSIEALRFKIAQAVTPPAELKRIRGPPSIS
jgi:hypothetical protein